MVMPFSMGILLTCRERYSLVLMSSSEANLTTPRNSVKALEDSATLTNESFEVKSLVIGSVASFMKRLALSSATSS